MPLELVKAAARIARSAIGLTLEIAGIVAAVLVPALLLQWQVGVLALRSLVNHDAFAAGQLDAIEVGLGFLLVLVIVRVASKR